MTKLEKAFVLAIVAVWFGAAGFIAGKMKGKAEGFAQGQAEGTLAGGLTACNDILSTLKKNNLVADQLECVPYQGQVSITAPSIPDAPHFHMDGTKF